MQWLYKSIFASFPFQCMLWIIIIFLNNNLQITTVGIFAMTLVLYSRDTKYAYDSYPWAVFSLHNLFTIFISSFDFSLLRSRFWSFPLYHVLCSLQHWFVSLAFNVTSNSTTVAFPSHWGLPTQGSASPWDLSHPVSHKLLPWGSFSYFTKVIASVNFYSLNS